MRPNFLRQKLNNGEPTLGTHIHSTWPSIVEAIGHTGHYDYVEFVAEYGPFDLHDLDNLGRAGDLYNMSMMIKVDSEHRAYVAQRAVGSGFHSVLFADVRSAEDVTECVRCVRADHPKEKGTYGVATRRFTYMGYGGSQAYVDALHDIVIVVMIEKESAVNQLEEILSVEGVDMIQWGSADYSMNIGRAGERTAPEVIEAQDYIFNKAKEMNIPARVELNSIADRQEHLDKGIRHFCIGTDVTILHQWWKENGARLRADLD
ncbi:MAG: aldolase/citrate lyase family protein [Candidatus Latescibacterota bacterium]|nr:aldolase/citrate lyase family protein [Candidatus Latescibacterota bacterium]